MPVAAGTSSIKPERESPALSGPKEHMDYKAIIARLLGIEIDDIFDFVEGNTMIFITYIEEDRIHNAKFYKKDLKDQ